MSPRFNRNKINSASRPVVRVVVEVFLYASQRKAIRALDKTEQFLIRVTVNPCTTAPSVVFAYNLNVTVLQCNGVTQDTTILIGYHSRELIYVIRLLISFWDMSVYVVDSPDGNVYVIVISLPQYTLLLHSLHAGIGWTALVQSVESKGR